ncbi:hypothetical protein WA026_020129 [Henosepilachna vigintioctopunctata]|uniref:Uncharacterized protein n=1 Tax=Henosepilachna vigintioctopunctata TaxID=420089 RepID=A0AAW1UF47_9CUCU
MQIRPTEQKLKKEKAVGTRSLDTIADGEYVISRQKPSKSPSKPHAIYDAYAQSWVFEADQAAASSNLESCTKIVKNGSPQNQSSQFHSAHNSYYTSVITEQTELLDTPVVHVEEASDDSTSNSDRKLFYMKSFSRATSPGPLSVSSSQNSLTLNPTSKPQIYEYLEKLTDPTVYRSRLNTALSDREEKDSTSEQTTSTITMQRMESLSPRYEKVQYASLIQELQKAIVNKKETISPQSNSGSVSTSDKTQTNSKSSSRHESSRSEAKGSDGDFSRELEAALQLIQDLESPNTIDTSSETKPPADNKANERPMSLWRDSNASIEGSDETQTGISSIGELMSPLSDHQLELRTFKLSGTENRRASDTTIRSTKN